MRAADEHRIGELHQVLDDFDFVGDFCAAENRDERPFGIGNCFAEIGEFLLHEQSCGGLLNEFRDADDGSVSAMRGAECIANEESVAQVRRAGAKIPVVGFFFGMKAHIFEQQYVAIAQALCSSLPLRRRRNRGRIRRACREVRCSRRRQARELYFGSALPFGRPSATRARVALRDPSRSAAWASVSRMRVSSVTLAPCHGDVEIHADENALALHSRSRMESLFIFVAKRSALGESSEALKACAARILIRSRQRQE